MLFLRGILLTAALILGAGLLLVAEVIVVTVLGRIFGWTPGVGFSILIALGVATAFVFIRVKRKHTIEILSLPTISVGPVNVGFGDVWSFVRPLSLGHWIGIAVLAVGALIYDGNISGKFPTIPNLGTAVMGIGIVIYLSAKPRA